MKNFKKNNKGFTLLELIVVMAIISVLAAILVPQFIQYVERARQSSDVQIASGIIQTATLAVADPTNRVPSGHYVEVLWITGTESGSYANSGQIMVRPGNVDRVSIFNDGTADDVPTVPLGTNLEYLAESIMSIMGATDMKFQNDDEYVASFDDAQSELGNSGNLAFHVHTSTGEVALAKLYGNTAAANKWVELGLEVTPAP